MIHSTRIALVFAIAALLGACGVRGGGESDAAVADARFLSDAIVYECSNGDGCLDREYQPICASNRGLCVECIRNSDCTLDSFGPTCAVEAGQCRCESDEECSQAKSGPRCHPSANACSCIDDNDCSDDQSCELVPYLGTGVRSCQPLPVDAGV